MKYSRKSQTSHRRSLLRRSNLLKVAMLMAALLVSTACTNIPTEVPNDPYRDILISMVPETPSPPPFPTLQWSYKDGKYCIGESDADRLLDYGENGIPLFTHELEQYQRKMLLILEALKQKP